MKKIMIGCVSAFAMYSAIPMPKVDFNEDNLQYTLCFLPFVGLLLSLSIYLLYLLGMMSSASNQYFISDELLAALTIAIPILITGGLHVDGYMDTIDAVSSRQEMSRKCDILKDPHVGAFAVIYSILYFIVMFGLTQQAFAFSDMTYIIFSFIFSRIFAVLSLLYLKPMKTSGLAYHFSNNASKLFTKSVMFFMLAICILSLLFLEGLVAIFPILGCFLLFLLYKSFVYKHFGGISGDTSGFLILIIEIYFAAVQILF